MNAVTFKIIKQSKESPLNLMKGLFKTIKQLEASFDDDPNVNESIYKTKPLDQSFKIFFEDNKH